MGHLGQCGDSRVALRADVVGVEPKVLKERQLWWREENEPLKRIAHRKRARVSNKLHVTFGMKRAAGGEWPAEEG